MYKEDEVFFLRRGLTVFEPDDAAPEAPDPLLPYCHNFLFVFQ
jgi:hypothetical protein